MRQKRIFSVFTSPPPLPVLPLAKKIVGADCRRCPLLWEIFRWGGAAKLGANAGSFLCASADRGLSILDAVHLCGRPKVGAELLPEVLRDPMLALTSFLFSALGTYRKNTVVFTSFFKVVFQWFLQLFENHPILPSTFSSSPY